LHPRQCDLEDRFPCLGTVGKDIQNDFLPVDDRDAGKLFPVALLRGGEGFIHHDQVGIHVLGQGDDLVGLAAAEECGRGGFAQVDQFGVDDADVQVLNEFLEFAEQLLGFARLHGLRVDAHEQGAFATLGFGGGGVVEEIGH
jgi:hypothetical protein